MSIHNMRETLLNLLISDAYKQGNYTLSSGKTSKHYVNCKPVTLTARGLYLVSNLMLQYIDEHDKYIAGLTLGADPLVSGVAVQSYNWANLRGLAHKPNDVSNMREPKRSVWDNNIELRQYLSRPVQLDALIIRKEPKGHGTTSQIEGKLPPKGSKITVLEDVVTTGGSCLKAVNVLRDAGYIVTKVITIVDRLECEPNVWYDNDIELKSLYTINDLV